MATYSTLLLTILLAVGLFFFIKASVKDRTEELQLLPKVSPELLFNELQEYFIQRGYQIVKTNADQNQIILAGMVRPSWFMAIFLTVLSAIGFLCLVLVLVMLLPDYSNWFFSLIILSPLTGIFYWRQAGRLEPIVLRIGHRSPLTSSFSLAQNQGDALITIVAHRDELATLQTNTITEKFSLSL